MKYCWLVCAYNENGACFINTYKQSCLTFCVHFHRMCRLVAIFFGLIIGHVCRAQFNDTVTHHLSISATGNINRTNSGTSYLLNNEARFSTKNKKTAFNSMAGWVYGRSETELTNNDFFSMADLNLFTSDSAKLYYWGLANFTSSYSLKINYQWQGGVGLAYNFFNDDVKWLNLSNGVLFESSELKALPKNDSYQTIRNSLRLSYNFVLAKKLSLYGSHFLQNSFKHKEDYILRSSTNLKIQLSKWIGFTTGVIYNEVSRNNTQNLFVKYGLTVEKFF